jgi:hypothetical protein
VDPAKCRLATTDVSAKKIADLAPVLAHIQHHLRRAQDVTRISERDGNSVTRGKRAVIINRHELADRFLGVLGAVKGLNRRQAVLGAFLGYERGIIPLDLGRILEHHARQISGRKGAVNIPLESLPAQVWQISAVVDMRVAKNDGLDAFGVEREVAVSLKRLVPVPLK